VGGADEVLDAQREAAEFLEHFSWCWARTAGVLAVREDVEGEYFEKWSDAPAASFADRGLAGWILPRRELLADWIEARRLHDWVADQKLAGCSVELACAEEHGGETFPFSAGPADAATPERAHHLGLLALHRLRRRAPKGPWAVLAEPLDPQEGEPERRAFRGDEGADLIAFVSSRAAAGWVVRPASDEDASRRSIASALRRIDAANGRQSRARTTEPRERPSGASG